MTLSISGSSSNRTNTLPIGWIIRRYSHIEMYKKKRKIRDVKTKWKNTSQILYYRLNESYNRTLCIYVFDEYFKRNWRDTNVNIRCLWGWIQWRCVCFFRLFREKIFFSLLFFRMENIHCPGDKLLPLVRCYWNLLWCSFFWGRRSPGSVCANAFTTLSEIHRELGFWPWRPSPSLHPTLM